MIGWTDGLCNKGGKSTYTTPPHCSIATSLISTRANSHNERIKYHWEKELWPSELTMKTVILVPVHSLQLFLVEIHTHFVKIANKDVVILKQPHMNLWYSCFSYNNNFYIQRVSSKENSSTGKRGISKTGYFKLKIPLDYLKKKTNFNVPDFRLVSTDIHPV